MNKSLKGALAAGAAALLLLGGAGSYALWQDSENVQAGTIATGDLDIAPASPAAGWTDHSADVKAANGGNPKNILAIADYRLVPGDELHYDANFTVVANGTNMKAKLTSNLASAVYNSATGLTATNAPITTVVKINNVVVPDGTITSAAAGQPVSVAVVLQFPSTANQARIGVNSTIDLTSFKLTLDQVRPGV